MTEWIKSIATTPGGVAGVGLAIGTVVAVFYAPKLALPAALLAVLAGGLGYVERLRDDVARLTAQVGEANARADEAQAEALHAANTAKNNADAAAELARDNEAQAQAYEADASQARADRDEIELARRAAQIAADSCKPPQPAVGAEVHGALQGRAAGEDDGLAPSMKAALQALKTKGGKR